MVTRDLAHRRAGGARVSAEQRHRNRTFRRANRLLARRLRTGGRDPLTPWVRWLYRRGRREALGALRREALAARKTDAWRRQAPRLLARARDVLLGGWQGQVFEDLGGCLWRKRLPALPPGRRGDLYAARRDLRDESLDVRTRVSKGRRPGASDNLNRLVTEGWSSRASRWLFRRGWPDEPELACQQRAGATCAGYAWFAPLAERFTCASFLAWSPYEEGTWTRS